MNTEKKKRNAGSKIAIIVIIVYLLLPLVMTLIYSDVYKRQGESEKYHSDL